MVANYSRTSVHFSPYTLRKLQRLRAQLRAKTSNKLTLNGLVVAIVEEFLDKSPGLEEDLDSCIPARQPIEKKSKKSEKLRKGSTHASRRPEGLNRTPHT